MKDWTIDMIEKLKWEDVLEMGEDAIAVKDHVIYLVDFGGYFGYSALVFYNDRHIYYANDYALHHAGRDKEWLKNWYIETISNKLFTDDELEVVIDYDDYERKSYYLRNYYVMRADYISCFRICHNAEEEAEYREKTKGLYFNPYSFCYMNDLDFIKKQGELFKKLEAANEKLNDDYDYWKNAFVKEMFNHEYGINWQANYDVFSSLFNGVQYEDDDWNYELYFKQLDLSPVKMAAFVDARKEYIKKCEY